MVTATGKRLVSRASAAALVVVVLAAVWSSVGAGARSSGGNGLPPACASLQAPTPPLRAVPGSAPINGPYAVFRRAQGTADVLPPDGASQFNELATYDPTATRLVFTTGVARVSLIRGHFLRLVVPGACLSRLPRAEALVLRVVGRQFRGQAAVCFSLDPARRGPNGSIELSMSCVQRAAGTGGYALAEIGGNSALEVGLVPDGVSRVDVRYRTAGTVHGTVRSNVVAYRPPAGVALTLAGRALRGPRRVVLRRLRRLILNSIPAQITWRDVHGQALRTFTPPPALLRDTLGGQARSSR